MSSTKPHFLLFCDGNGPATSESAANRGRWRFILECVETGDRSEASDVELGCAPDRCALIAVLRGLEALEQPSRVTLITANRYVTRGLQYGLTEWRDNDFSWEHFGAVQPIRNADIWRRIDRTLAYHLVQCRWMSQDEAPPIEESAIVLQEATECVERIVSTRNVPTVRETEPAYTSRPSSRVVTLAPPDTSKPSDSSRPSATDIHPASLRKALTTPNAQQRFYVDTPISHDSSSASTKFSNSHSSSLEMDVPTLNSAPTRDTLRSRTGIRWVLSPILLAIRKMKALSQCVWETILAIDGWLESFLRCLVLLDPQDRRSRQ